MKRCLLIDAGNTRIKFALAENGAITHTESAPTSTGHQPAELHATVKQFLDIGLSGATVDTCLCSSVVPWADQALAQAVRDLCGKSLFFVPTDIPIPLKSVYAEKQLGADRLVAAYAARRLFPDANEIVCVDFGTATTFGCVCGDTYLGGLICPGVESAAEGLAAHTAKLSRVVLTPEVDSTRVIGTNTTDCMQFGFLQGFAAMTDGIIDRIAHSRHHETGTYPLVLATGGMAAILAPACSRLSHIMDNLVLQGLNFLSETAG